MRILGDKNFNSNAKEKAFKSDQAKVSRTIEVVLHPAHTLISPGEFFVVVVFRLFVCF